MKFRELERIIIKEGWVYKDTVGSHCQYIHPLKKGKVTIPRHNGDIPIIVEKSVLKQAQIIKTKEGNCV